MEVWVEELGAEAAMGSESTQTLLVHMPLNTWESTSKGPTNGVGLNVLACWCHIIAILKCFHLCIFLIIQKVNRCLLKLLCGPQVSKHRDGSEGRGPGLRVTAVPGPDSVSLS